MSKHPAVVVDWFGPYDLDDKGHALLGETGGTDWERPGIYVAIGEREGAGNRGIEYIGIGKKKVAKRVAKDHHKLGKVVEPKLWLGEIANRGNGSTYLICAEWGLIFALQPELNEKLKQPPRKAVTLLNRWWKDDGESRRKSPHPAWPDIVDFLFRGRGRAEATLQWIGKDQRVERKFTNGHWTES